MLDKNQTAALRKSYVEKELNENMVDKNPFIQLTSWLNEAINSNISEPNAMVLSTCTKDGMPSSRVVLLKGIEKEDLLFFTNYQSRKAKELLENPNAALLFFWRDLGRQIRITGSIKQTTKKESEEYFITRPYLSRIAAWASHQSSVINGRELLEKKFDEYKKLYPDDDVPLPPFWGGFKLNPDYFEFWQGRENRLHDRIAYRKKDKKWEIRRLAP
jgi:pyridoxamine 5'-phosphate oxidase